jgi:hypothetical protein
MFAYHPNMEKVEAALQEQNIREIGKLSRYDNIYTDKRKENRTNEVGAIIDSQDRGKLDAHSDIYKIMEFPSKKMMVVRFPYKTIFSCMVGHIRGTKEIYEYLKTHSNEYAPIREIYNIHDHVIYYATDIQE